MKPGNSFLTGLLAGAAIGGVIALLYAPKSGKETREQIKTKLADLEAEFNTLKEKATGKSDQIRKDIEAKLAELRRDLEAFSNSH
ncbi:MAG: YtxH domain-containing protein [Bacteroidota bacterium]|nr:MAG: YtxH domain-containing protein [Bacteroidota bacterium]